MGTKPKLTKEIKVRVSEFEYYRIKELARKYAMGNVSLYMVYHSINAKRKFIDLDEVKNSSRRQISKGGKKPPLPNCKEKGE